MKTTVCTGVFSLILAFAVVQHATAQCTDYKWPEDGELKAKAEESLVLLKDNKASGQFKLAIPPLTWLLTNTPDLNKSIYIYGAEVYDGLAKKEKDTAKKAKYVDSLMIIYDLRLKNTPCGEEASIANRKALSAYGYYINNDKATDLLKYMEEAIKLGGVDVMDGTLVPYMQAIQVNKLKFKNMTDEEVMQRYEDLSEIINQKIKKSPGSAPKYNTYQSQIDDILTKTVPVDCDLVKKSMEPKYRANPADIDLARKIFGLMLAGKCTDDPLWMDTGEALVKDAISKGEKPDFAIAKNIGIKYLAQDNFSKAEELLKIALSSAPTGEDKADVLIYLGSIEARRGSKVAARELYRQALGAQPGRKDAFEKIGDLYMNSFEECKEEESMADDRRVFLIAYDYYQKAGEGRKMNAAKEGFPSKEELFLKNYQVGSSTRVGCWINESTTWRSRD